MHEFDGDAKIVSAALKVKAWTFEAKAIGSKAGHRIWPQGASRPRGLHYCKQHMHHLTDKANILGEFFSGVYTSEPEATFEELKPKTANKAFGNILFSDSVITEKLKNLNINKSQGPDTIHPRNEIRNKIVTPLHLIFEASFASGVILEDWKIANTVAVHKKAIKQMSTITDQ